jgi:hypothetical protein
MNNLRKNILIVGLVGALVLYIENILTFSQSIYINLFLITSIVIITISLIILKFFSQIKSSYFLLACVGFMTYLISSFLLVIARTIFNTVTHFNSAGGYIDVFISIIWIGALLSLTLAFVIHIIPKK